jgi:RecG-like helicase
LLDFRLANISSDRKIFEAARNEAENIIGKDPLISAEENIALRSFLILQKGINSWSMIS